MTRAAKPTLFISLLLISVGSAFWAGHFFGGQSEKAPGETSDIIVRPAPPPPDKQVIPQTDIPPIPETPPEILTVETEPPELDQQGLQAMMNDLGEKYDGQFGLVVYDLTADKEIASWNGESAFSTGSLYKLYLNFLAYQDLEKGTLDPFLKLKHPELGGIHLKTCLVLMIQLSDIPCAETVRSFYNDSELQRRVDQLGLTDYSVAGFHTSARDMVKLLRLVWRGEHITPESRALMLSAMKHYIFIHNLPVALDGLGTTYNAVGYKQEETWNDIAIIELHQPERVIAVALLTSEIFGDDMEDITSNLRRALEGNYPVGGAGTPLP